MLYSAATQPVPAPRKNGGTFSSTVAEQITFVSPNEITTEPSGCLKTLVSIVIFRNSFGARLSCLIIFVSS